VRDDPRFGEPLGLSESLANPQLEPADHCYTILQDHGPADGGWGPAAIAILPTMPQPTPFVYTGSDPRVLAVIVSSCRQLAQRMGKPTRLVRYDRREDYAVFGGSS